MTSVIAGWRWAVLDAAQPNLGQVAVGVAVACVLFVDRARHLPLVGAEASRTRSDVGRDRGRLALEEVPPRRVPGGLRDAPRDARPRRAAARAAGAPSPGLRGLGAPATSRSTCPRARSSASSDATAPASRRCSRSSRGSRSPTEGRAEIRGRVGSLLEVGTGFNQELTGRENVYLNGAILGMKRREIEQRFDDIVEFSGVERFIDTPVKRYSSGMYVRLAFAVAAHLEPEILFVDEVLSVGDAEFQRALSRADGGAREHRPDGALRLPCAAGRRPALRSRDLDRRRHAWCGDGPSGGGDRELPPSDACLRALERTWPRRPRPGNDLARIRAIRVVAHEGMPPGVVDVRRPVGIEIGFDVLTARASRRSRRSRCSTRRARSPSTRWTPTSAGSGRPSPATYIATAWIPGNLLNEGSAIVEAAICSIDFPKLSTTLPCYEAVSFEVLDPGEGDSSRGQFSGQWRGVVRPLLEWTVR